MTDSVLASIAALSTLPIPALKERWRELFQTEPPAFNRGYLENRLTYRIQELAYGGVAPVTNTRLDAIATDEKYIDRETARKRIPERPVPGTRIVREWQGVEHAVTVLESGYEYLGRPFKSLSAVANASTGSRWSGPLFFGVKSQGGDK